ncbi:HD domain-containing protein [Arcobacter sp. FWKO B]|uniref:[protein-PII] uridylyltransferase family protein n=1 Tax=Arcobacter sp. FWKO B TaxID=2593672 RepID=UPI0018A5528F|nr:HD domain-containing protein [Arcobacter sp. FWKO B]QOG12336.1 HD domain-containing protein [Arcobacter sp. FWKO B]
MSDLSIKIEELIDSGAKDFEISKLIKNSIKEYLGSLDEIFTHSGGKDFFVKHTKQIDSFIIHLYKYILRKHFGQYQPLSNAIPITIVALGSYGREQLCVYSDIDLMLLYEDTKGYNIKNILEEFLTLAWDAGLKLGHRVHELKEIDSVVKEDITIKTAIIESRMIYGSKQLWHNYQNSLKRVRNHAKLEFIEQKIAEHKARLAKYPLIMEPNVKDGYGGMRESNLLFWICNVIYGVSSIKELSGKLFSEDEYKNFRSSLEFVFRVRNALHLIAKKKQDSVNFDILPELSTKLGFKNKTRITKERECMTRLFESFHNIHFFSAVMTKKVVRPFLYDKDNYAKIKSCRISKNIYVCDKKVYTSFNSKPMGLNGILKELISLDNVESFDQSYLYHVNKTILTKRETKETKRLIKELFKKEKTFPYIKLLYNSRLFFKLLPHLKGIQNQPQFDGYHKHPVDLHSIKAIKNLENIQDEFVNTLYNSLSNEEKALLRILVLFHDSGKGRGGDHHIVGERIFRKFAKSFDLDDETTTLGARIVRYHNMMNYVATREDIYSQHVIFNFIGLLQTEQTLRLLFVLTYSDISSVGKDVYKSTTANLLKELFLQSIMAFENAELVKDSTKRVLKLDAIKKNKTFKELDTKLQKKILAIQSIHMFLKLKVSEILDIAIWAENTLDYDYEIVNNEVLTIHIIKKHNMNLSFLLGKLSAYLNISSMGIYKLFDGKKFYEIVFDERVEQSDIEQIKELIQSSFISSKQLKLKKPVILKENIQIECDYTENLAALKIEAKDQKGLFAYIAKMFEDFGIDIESAKIYTSKGIARDLILIEKNGQFCPNKDEFIDLLSS